MRGLSQRLLISLSLVLFFDFQVEAFPKKFALCAGMVATLLYSPVSADIIRSTDGRLLDRKWPYEGLNTALTKPAYNFNGIIQNAHDEFEDYFFYEGASALWTLSDFPQDSLLPRNIGPTWVSVTGEYSDTIILTDPPAMPWNYAYGTQVIYDSTPHTPNLWQETWVDWSQYPFKITVTHKAWILIDLGEQIRNQNLDFDRHYGTSVPGPTSLLVLATGLSFASRRNRVSN